MNIERTANGELTCSLYAHHRISESETTCSECLGLASLDEKYLGALASDVFPNLFDAWHPWRNGKETDTSQLKLADGALYWWKCPKRHISYVPIPVMAFVGCRDCKFEPAKSKEEVSLIEKLGQRFRLLDELGLHDFVPINKGRYKDTDALFFYVPKGADAEDGIWVFLEYDGFAGHHKASRIPKDIEKTELILAAGPNLVVVRMRSIGQAGIKVPWLNFNHPRFVQVRVKPYQWDKAIKEMIPQLDAAQAHITANGEETLLGGGQWEDAQEMFIEFYREHFAKD